MASTWFHSLAVSVMVTGVSDCIGCMDCDCIFLVSIGELQNSMRRLDRHEHTFQQLVRPIPQRFAGSRYASPEISDLERLRVHSPSVRPLLAIQRIAGAICANAERRKFGYRDRYAE